MNTTVLFTLLRYALTLGGGYLVKKGVTDGGTVDAIVGTVIAAASAGYGSWTSTRPAQIKAVQAIPGVKVVPDGTGAQSQSVNSAMNDR